MQFFIEAQDAKEHCHGELYYMPQYVSIYQIDFFYIEKKTDQTFRAGVQGHFGRITLKDNFQTAEDAKYYLDDLVMQINMKFDF